MSRTDLSGNKSTRVRIDVFSDTICPWCWIGKRRLERTLEARPDLDAEMVWHAFQLNPAMPVEGMDRNAYLDAKFGGADNARAVYGRVIRSKAANLASLSFHFDARCVISGVVSTEHRRRLTLRTRRRWAADQPLGSRRRWWMATSFDAYFADAFDQDHGSTPSSMLGLHDCGVRHVATTERGARLRGGDAGGRRGTATRVTREDIVVRARRATTGHCTRASRGLHVRS